MNSLEQQAADLRAQAAALDAQIAQHKSAARAGLLAQAKALIVENGFTANELGLKAAKPGRQAKAGADGRSHPSAGQKVAVKYRSGDNTWTGRGVKPRWLSTAISNGANLESFAV